MRPSIKSRRTRNTISWWAYPSISKPRDPFERKAKEELIDFARSTLSVNPTATATELTFSLENRVHGRSRASLDTERVKKILFCQ